MRWWWRKRADNFEWRKYVRTTILVRRNERRQKVEDAKQAAIFGVKQAGQKGVEAGAAGLGVAGRASKAAAGAVGRGGAAVGSAVGRGGSAVGRGGVSFGGALGRGAVSAARASRAGLYAGGAALGRASGAGLRRVGSAAGPHLLRARDGTIDRLEPAIQGLLRPSIAMPLMIVAIAVGAGAVFRWLYVGFDYDVAVAGTIAIIAGLLTLLPRAAVGDMPRPLAAAANFVGGLPGFNRVSPMAGAGALVALLAVAGMGYWILSHSGGGLQTAAVTSRANDAADDGVPKVAVTRLPDLKGRGNALAGDLVKVSGTTVKLAGIEAPEKDQRCGVAERSRRCGEAARDALARLIRSQPIVCKLAGTDDSGFRLASCASGEKDIAAELVRNGHVFAMTGFFSRYGSEEGEARSARAGIWQDEAVERPADFRAKRWEEAKQTAPQGCPIKGSLARGSRTYVLPWSPSYERVRVRENRGERWFCSEQEAKAAGWRLAAL